MLGSNLGAPPQGSASRNLGSPTTLGGGWRLLSEAGSVSLRPPKKSISAFSNYGATVPGTVRATSTAHGMPAGTTANVVISGTASYNGTYTVTYIDADHFYFTATWVATETGQFECGLWDTTIAVP